MDDPALLNLLQQWFWARPTGAFWDSTPQPIREVPARLVATIIHDQPYRSQALQDVLLWLQLPLLIGIRLEPIPVEPFVIRAVEHWEKAVSPLAVRLCWSSTMAGNEIDWTSDGIECVAREPGRW